MENWNRRRGQQQAYLAGILDGEGSFGIYHVGGAYSGRITLGMQTPEAVMMLKTLYPEGKYTQRGEEFRVVYNQFNAYTITEEFIPFLIGKHEQAKVLLSFLVHRRRDHQKKAANGKGYCDRCEHFVKSISSLKQEISWVNSVNALLKHGLREYRAKREDVEKDVAAMHTLQQNLEGVETRDRLPQAVEPMSAQEKEIVPTVVH